MLLLQTTAEDMFRTYRYCLHGSFRTGRIGFNINATNTLASVFTATGQDIAALSESSTAYFVMEPATHENIKTHCVFVIVYACLYSTDQLVYSYYY